MSLNDLLLLFIGVVICVIIHDARLHLKEKQEEWKKRTGRNK